MLLFRDKDGFTKQVTTAGVITFVTEQPLKKETPQETSEANFNANTLEVIIVENSTKMVSYPYVPIRYYVLTDADTVELNSKIQYVHEISIELPFSTKNHKDIEQISNSMIKSLYAQAPQLSLCELSLHYRYHYQLDETYELEGMYDEMVLNSTLMDDLVDIGFDLNSHTFMLSLVDMSKCDSVMRHYIDKYS